MSTLTVGGTVRVPGDKSISHRALMLSSMAEGTSRVRGLLQSADIQSTAGALRALGASIPALTSDIRIAGKGAHRFRSPGMSLDCGNSGTTARLLAGIVAGLEGVSARFEGDASLSQRPMQRVAIPLRLMGASITFEPAPPRDVLGGTDGERPATSGHRETLPMHIDGRPLTALEYTTQHASAQVKSAVLLAAVAANVRVQLREPQQSRDHTERMLLARGLPLHTDDGVVLAGRAGSASLPALDIDVPGDPSSAAFFVALAAMATTGSLTLPDVCLNPTRTGAFDVLRRMGADVRVEDERDQGGEPVGTLIASASALSGTVISGAEIPRCIDELPLLACVAACADGETLIRDAAELRVKESDRIKAVVEGLTAVGVVAEERPDGLRVVGTRRALRGHVHTHGDHRLAMAFGILAAMPDNRISVDDPGCVAVSYPAFWLDLTSVISVGGAAPVDDATRSAKPGFVVAIDGPAASGKSSTAQWVAEKLGVRHVDSGAFYRALAYVALGRQPDATLWTDTLVLADSSRIAQRLTQRSVLPHLDAVSEPGPVDEALRGPLVTAHVSQVARMPAAREWVNAQVRLAARQSDVVVDGRDIGTAVFPDAPLKVFLVADPWERARRRLIQRLGRSPVDLEIAAETESLVARDAQDATQSAPARDAITIDTTSLTQAEQVERIVALAQAATRRLRL